MTKIENKPATSIVPNEAPAPGGSLSSMRSLIVKARINNRTVSADGSGAPGAESAASAARSIFDRKNE